MSPPPPPPPPPPQAMGDADDSAAAAATTSDRVAEARINLALLEPQRWGWTAASGVVDLLPPHERARRQSSRTAFLRSRRKRERSEASITTAATAATATATAATSSRNGLLKGNSSGAITTINGDKNADPTVATTTTTATTAAAKSATTTAAASSLNCAEKKDPTTTTTTLPEENKNNKNPQSTATATATANHNNGQGRASSSTRDNGNETQQQHQQNGKYLCSETEGITKNHLELIKKDTPQHQSTAVVGASAPAKETATAAAAPTAVTAPATATAVTARQSNSTSDEQQQEQANNNGTTTSGDGDGAMVLQFRALQDDQKTLDIYSYHRGREGMELRDEQTGDLLCDVQEPTDTNNVNVGGGGGYGNSSSIQGTKLTATVTIQIPILSSTRSSSDDDANQNTICSDGVLFQQDGESQEITQQQQQQRQQQHYFRETLTWDLRDLDTVSPMMVAANLAENFGLTFVETLKVAESIQEQLASFLTDHCSYAVPLSYIDPSTERKREVSGGAHSSSSHYVSTPQLYGNVTGPQEGGLEQYTSKNKDRNLARSASTASSAGPKRSSSLTDGNAGATGHKGKAPSKRTSSSSSRRMSSKAAKKSSSSSASQRHHRRSLVQPIYRAEIQKRLCLASADSILNNNNNMAAAAATARQEDGGAVAASSSIVDGCGQISMAQNLVCHICCQPQQRVCIFACGIEEHAYCVNHIEELLGLNVSSSLPEEPIVWDHCPICALACPCESCVPKLEGLALEFQSNCLKQQRSPGAMEFEGLFEYSKMYEPKLLLGHEKTAMSGTATADVTTKKRAPPGGRKRVAKLSVLQFPREVYQGMYTDPGTELDYAATYSESGRHVSDQTSAAVGASTTALVTVQLSSAGSGSDRESMFEDGSIDFCMICRGPGDLLCCDYCPRAFHSACMDRKTDENEKSDDPWRCPACCRENEGLAEDKIDGSKSLSLICAAYARVGDKVSAEDSNMFRLLSMLHEMLLRLMDYDFGYTFREPVDLLHLPGYAEVVNKPMDLGTIAKNLINDDYRKNNEAESLEEVALAVLKDIELVWQNCFTFNFEGSAVYRMAEVQRRRAHAIRLKSFDDLLTDTMKRVLSDYASPGAHSCRNDINNSRVPSAASLPADTAATSSITSSMSRNKIVVSKSSPKARVVGILDPDSRRVVKMYSSMHAAGIAVKFLLGLAHPCEWPTFPVDTVAKVRKIIRESSTDPENLLFGHRWLFMDDLINGKVKFPKQQGQQSDAIATSTAGVAASAPSTSDAGVAGESAGEATVAQAISSILLAPDDGLAMGNGSPDLAGAVVKADLISGRRLASFSSIDAAFDDWLQSCNKSSLGVCSEVNRTIGFFRSQYLEGNRNIEGVVWKRNGARCLQQVSAMDIDKSADEDRSLANSTALAANMEDSQEPQNASPKPAESSTAAKVSESREDAFQSSSSFPSSKSNATAVTDEERKEALFDVSLRIGSLQNGTTSVTPLMRETKRARHDDPVTA